MAKLIPLGDQVVVKPMLEENRSIAGILLPDKDEKPQKGKVVAVGTGRKYENGTVGTMNVMEGDIVIFKKYAPDEFEIDGEKVLILGEDSILAKIEG
ncbi:co-chaperone GroES [Candidatus Peregrinibacteria bacterium CG11_big_fil_rev_8_21_14_0_20_41_10]|nr:MAG: co-chaperone GroES [Candidatus Peregrinibacteria bacterium CG11_big_fil_rev_8_21_14_0_20_41_10]PIZ73295.1 MAG: co-chaperone GroES [Candidatus Peregrinibacteria bacterium CG_4_10_14_0_2_um_filter_41_8]PJC38019.1 MAG: co-chaperone GroES [Candidatus Peregrinibacteria bacterium CG_4_9_14_0_2_um_filter_41_14]